jgi:cytoskeletal protein RodZ
MKSLGEYLQSERLARGITLEQIYNDTKISSGMLEAIEQGNTKRLPAPVLVRGFLRAYANRIGLDPDVVILRYEELIDEGAARQEALEKFHQRMRPKPSGRKWPTFLFTLTLLTGLALYFWWPKHTQQQPPVSSEKQSGPSTETPRETVPDPSVPMPEEEKFASQTQETPGLLQKKTEAEPLPPPPVVQPPPSPPEEQTVAAQEEMVSPTPDSQQQVAPPPPVVTGHVLRAEVLEPTWLHITIDERSMREYLLSPGEQLVWKADTRFRLHIGNAAGLRLYLNDMPLKPLGESGMVVHLQLPDLSMLMAPDSSDTDAGDSP